MRFHGALFPGREPPGKLPHQMRILQLSHKPPRPALDGGCLAIDAMTSGLLAAGARVKVLTASTRKHPLVMEDLDIDYLEHTDLEGVSLETGLDIRDAYMAFMNGDSYNISRFYSHQYAMVLKKVLSRERFDVVHLESLYTTPYIETIRHHAPTALVSLRSHNHEYQIWEQRYKATRNPFHRLVLRHLSKTLERYEKGILAELDTIVAISSTEGMGYRNWGFEGPIHVAGFGIPSDDVPHAPIPERKAPLSGHVKLYHLGAMDWGPNREGVEWFIREVWPVIRSAHPHSEFHVAGRGLNREIWSSEAGVFNHGEVEDAASFGQQCDLLVVPLLRGAGIRVKIVESMSRGIPVASTTIGLHGLDLDDGECVLQSPPEQFASALVELISHPERLQTMEEKGMTMARTSFDQKRIGAGLLEFYRAHVRI